MTPTKDIEAALKKFKAAADFIEDQRKREREDLAFQIPHADYQWPDDVRKARSAQTIAGWKIPPRPMLCVATLDEPIQLVLNQEKAAHLGPQIHPITEDASDDTAQVLQGLYRNIERDSRAQLARSWAYNRSTKCGTGGWRVNKVYDPSGGDPFDQKLVIKRILYQDAIFLDPFAQEPDWSDGEYAFIVENMPIAKFRRRYGESKLAKASNTDFSELADLHEGWVSDDNDDERTVRVAEYWRVEITTRTLVLLDDNSSAYRDDIPEGRTVKTGPEARHRDVETRKVFWSTINCVEELDPAQEWDGEYIPIIPSLGNELQPFDGIRRWMGMVAPAKDGARLVNYAASNAVEMAALEPKAPFIMEEGQDEGHKLEWENANIVPFPALKYRRIGLSGLPGEMPQRVQADMSRLGPSMQLLSMGKDFVQSATATFDPALGKQTTAHRSGRAILALQDQTQVGTSQYLDNLAQVSMTYEAMVILDLIPHVYDRAGRVAQILDENDKASTVMLNAPFAPGTNGRPQGLLDNPETQANVANPDHPAKHYDLNKGRYGVSVTIGKSAPTRLQEGTDAIGQLLQAAPELMIPIGPEWMKFQDYPGAQNIAKILTKLRDAQFPMLAQGDGQAPNPQQLAAENQALRQQLDMAAKAMEAKQLEQDGKFRIAAMQEGAEGERAAADRETKITIAQIAALAKELQDTRQFFMEERARLGLQAHEADQAERDRAHDAGMAAQDHAQTIAQSAQDHDNAIVQAAHAQAITPQEPTGNGAGA